MAFLSSDFISKLIMAELLRLFISGIMLGNGPCLFFCVPIILPYIGGMPQEDGSGSGGWKRGLKLSFIFSLFRLLAYSLLGLFSVLFYRIVFSLIGSKGVYLQPALGALIILIGIFYLFNINQRFSHSNPLCALLQKKLARNSSYNMALFGLLVGFSPCAPLMAVLTYIAATAKDPLWGLLAGASFGIGTVITPLIPLGILTGFIADKIKKSQALIIIMRLLSAVLLIYFGLRLVSKLGFI